MVPRVINLTFGRLTSGRQRALRRYMALCLHARRMCCTRARRASARDGQNNTYRKNKRKNPFFSPHIFLLFSGLRVSAVKKKERRSSSFDLSQGKYFSGLAGRRTRAHTYP